MSSSLKSKVKKIWLRDGNNCWLCKQPLDSSLAPDHKMRTSVDHVIPRKWGGSNELSNLKLAHQNCNSSREVKFPETLVFTEQDILLGTNPNHLTGGLSGKALKAVKAMKRTQYHIGGELLAPEKVVVHPDSGRPVKAPVKRIRTKAMVHGTFGWPEYKS